MTTPSTSLTVFVLVYGVVDPVVKVCSSPESALVQGKVIAVEVIDTLAKNSGEEEENKASEHYATFLASVDSATSHDDLTDAMTEVNDELGLYDESDSDYDLFGFQLLEQPVL